MLRGTFRGITNLIARTSNKPPRAEFHARLSPDTYDHLFLVAKEFDGNLNTALNQIIREHRLLKLGTKQGQEIACPPVIQ